MSRRRESSAKFIAFQLRLLQVKHEEEIEVLLEEKMQLSKKLDAVQNWTPCIGKFPY